MFLEFREECQLLISIFLMISGSSILSPVARQGQNCREATCSGHAGPQRWSPGRRRAGDCGARPASARPGSRGTVSTRPDPDGTAAPSRRAGTCRGPRDAGSQVSSALRAPPATVGAPCTWLWPRTPASSDADAPGPLASGLHSWGPDCPQTHRQFCSHMQTYCIKLILLHVAENSGRLTLPPTYILLISYKDMCSDGGISLSEWGCTFIILG